MERATPPLLIPVHSGTWFIELQRVARACRSSRRYDPVLLFTVDYPHRARDVAACVTEGIACLDEYGAAMDGSGGPSARSSRQVRARAAWRRFWAPLARLAPLRILDSVLEIGRRLRFARRAIEAVEPALLVLAGDNVGYDTACFIRAARDAGLHTVLVPSTMSNGLEEAEVYSKSPRHLVRGGLNSLAAALHPRWARRHKGVTVLRVPGERVLALEWYSLAPPHPWSFNSGFAEAIAVESPAMRRYYLDGGLPADPLVDTGSLANDELALALKDRDSRRGALCQELGLSPARPILLCALPPDFLYLDGGRPECDFRRYDDLVASWMSAIASVEGFNRVVCLHPSMAVSNWRQLEDRYGVRIATQPTVALIPLSDLYVASVSSTIRWAIACAVPVVNYDVYRYRYTDFRDVPGVLSVEEHGAFRDALRRFDTEPGFREAMRARIGQASEDWGRLDGGAALRLLDLFDRLAVRSR